MNRLEALVTGGAGFIGYHLSNHLLSLGYKVTILDNLTRGQKDSGFAQLIEDDNVTFVDGDILQREALDKLGNQFDQVYHLAAINGTSNFYKKPDEVLRVGIVGTLNVLDWFVKQKKGKLLFASSAETYAGALRLLGNQFPVPTPEDIPLVVEDTSNVRWSYGVSKIASEVAMYAYAKVKNLNQFVIVRYHNVYGPRMGNEHVIPQFIDRLLGKEKPFRIFGGESTRAFCYIEDAVKATSVVIESSSTNGQVVNIGSDAEEISMIELARKLFEITGVNPPIEISFPPEGSVKRRCPDISKLRRLGFTPKRSLEDGLRLTYEYYKSVRQNA